MRNGQQACPKNVLFTNRKTLIKLFQLTIYDASECYKIELKDQVYNNCVPREKACNTDGDWICKYLKQHAKILWARFERIDKTKLVSMHLITIL